MKKTLYNLAKSNIKNYKKHYLIVSIIIFIVSVIMFSYIVISENNNEVIKTYNIATYGHWYTSIENIQEETKIGIETYSEMYFKDEIQYGYVKNQGSYKDYLIGHVDNSIYDLCKIDIINGRKLSQDNEILVSDIYAKRENAKINEKITIDGIDYVVVGITHTNNKGLPDIYTNLDNFLNIDYYSNMELGHNASIGFYDENDKYLEFSLDYQYNPHGYDQNSINKKVNDALTVLSTFFEIIVITVFILLALTSSSLKKRQKEMALLRGIGMTTSQLMMMILFENIMISIFSIMMGFILSIVVSFVFMYYQSTIYQMFIYNFDLQTIFITLIILVFCIFISAIIPIVSSSKSALTGSFDSQKFKYIQVRYRKLKKQSLSYLASRELKVNKKMNICYFIFVVMLSMYGLVYLYNGHTIYHTIYTANRDVSQNYVSVSTHDQNVLDDFLKKFPDETMSYEESTFNDYTILQYHEFKDKNHSYAGLIDNNQFEVMGELQGKLPVQSHEILVTQRISEITLSMEDYPEIFQNIDNTNWAKSLQINGTEYEVYGGSMDENDNYVTLDIEVEMPQIGDSIYINDEEFVISAILTVDKDSGYGIPAIFLYQDDFDMLTIKESRILEAFHYFENSDIEDVKMFLKGKNNGENETYYNNNIEYRYESMEEFNFEIKVEYLIGIIVAGLVIILFLNYNNIENNYQDYQMYHILGMSYQEIKKKQLWKSVHMIIITSIPIIAYFIVLTVLSIDHYMPIIKVLGILLVVIVFYLIVYNVPLYLVMNNHKNEELRNGDE